MGNLQIKIKNNNSGKIKLQFIQNNNSLLKEIDFTANQDINNLSHELAWYYKKYLLNPYKQYKRALFINETIDNVGKQLGTKFFDDEQFLKLRTIDLSNATVTIESDDTAFFDIPWETMILPGSAQPLSTCSGSFVRTNSKEYKQKEQVGLNEEHPLHILIVAPRPQVYDDYAFFSNPVNIINKLLEFEQGIEVEILATNTVKTLEEKLSQKDKPIHILHFSGYSYSPADKNEEKNHLVFEDDDGKADYRDITIISDMLGKSGIDTVVLDIANVSDQSDIHTISSALALSLIKNGIHNIITTSYNSCTSSLEKIYHYFYSFIAQGKSVSEAVIESRKTIKENSKKALLTAQELEYADWPLILHYGSDDTQFFKEEVKGKPLFQSKTYAEISGNILGFNPQFQIPDTYIGGNRKKQEILWAFNKNNIVLLKGSVGIGKTHFVHQLAYCCAIKKYIEKAFYFDFKAGPLTRNQILLIIGETLDGKGTNPEDSLQKILMNKYLLVFDNIEYSLIKDKGYKTFSNEEKNDFFGLIENIKNHNSYVILTTSEEIIIPVNNCSKIKLIGLDIYERRQLAAGILRTFKNEEEEIEPEYYELIDSTDGHPYVIKTLLSNLSNCNVKEILSGYKKELKMHKDDKILALFEYGWKKIPDNQKKILLSLSGLKSYITDGFPIAAEIQTDNNNFHGKELYKVLDIDDQHSLRDALKNASYSGLYVKDKFGYQINQETQKFLKSKKYSKNTPQLQESRLNLLYAKINALELKVLASFISQNPDPGFYQKIIQNLSRWLESLEILWNIKEYNLFLGGKFYLTSILKNIGLKKEIDELSYRIIKNIDFESFVRSSTDNGLICWLNNAADAIEQDEILKNEKTAQWVKYWEQYIQSDNNISLEVYNNILMFLESKYRKENNWNARKKISELSINYYREKKEYERLIISLKSLARCEEAIGNIDRSREIENELLNNIPYSEIYEGAKQQAILDIASNHYRRQEYNEAGKLLNQVKEMPDIGNVHTLAEIIEGEISYKLKDYKHSAICFSHVWREVMKGKNITYSQKIAIKLNELFEKMGKDAFMNIFEKEAPGIKSPVELNDYSQPQNNQHE